MVQHPRGHFDCGCRCLIGGLVFVRYQIKNRKKRDIIKRHNKSQIIKLFNLTPPFIEKIREEYNNQSLAMEFEKFARSLESSD